MTWKEIVLFQVFGVEMTITIVLSVEGSVTDRARREGGLALNSVAALFAVAMMSELFGARQQKVAEIAVNGLNGLRSRGKNGSGRSDERNERRYG